MEAARQSVGVRDWGVANASLEDVFIQVTSELLSVCMQCFGNALADRITPPDRGRAEASANLATGVKGQRHAWITQMQCYMYILVFLPILLPLGYFVFISTISLYCVVRMLHVFFLQLTFPSKCTNYIPLHNQLSCAHTRSSTLAALTPARASTKHESDRMQIKMLELSLWYRPSPQTQCTQCSARNTFPALSPLSAAPWR